MFGYLYWQLKLDAISDLETSPNLNEKSREPQAALNSDEEIVDPSDLGDQTKGFYSLLEIEDEEERLGRFEICLNRLVGELKRFNPRDYLEAIRE